MTDCEVPPRPHTVGSMPKSYVPSNFIMKLIKDIENEATTPTVKTKPVQKNYLKENLKRLKEIEASAKLKNMEKQPLQPVKVINKYGQVPSKISTTINAPNCKGEISSSLKTVGPVRSQPPLSPCLSSRSDGCRSLQTCKSLPQLNCAQDNIEVTEKFHSGEEELHCEKSSHNIACSRSKHKAESKSEAKHRLGHIPTYLTERKKQWELEKEKQIKLMEEASIPPGHTLLPDEERLETLELLKKNEEELIRSLCALPVRNDTIRLRNYKEELERQLAKVEEGIKIFSRPKVLIKNDT
ncbi:enkurin domain-containing protein 1-like isoform X2 [Stegodyphus dumicola]|nr:enkurin domain-containing protein 1-like isoform X2 [Stegodyphus dumicola]XP_035231141.1 enkurin domain-containing protein 1-like isoform X2 [Stegodyphus dumicola]